MSDLNLHKPLTIKKATRSSTSIISTYVLSVLFVTYSLKLLTTRSPPEAEIKMDDFLLGYYNMPKNSSFNISEYQKNRLTHIVLHIEDLIEPDELFTEVYDAVKKVPPEKLWFSFAIHSEADLNVIKKYNLPDRKIGIEFHITKHINKNAIMGIPHHINQNPAKYSFSIDYQAMKNNSLFPDIEKMILTVFKNYREIDYMTVFPFTGRECNRPGPYTRLFKDRSMTDQCGRVIHDAMVHTKPLFRRLSLKIAFVVSLASIKYYSNSEFVKIKHRESKVSHISCSYSKSKYEHEIFQDDETTMKLRIIYAKKYDYYIAFEDVDLDYDDNILMETVYRYLYIPSVKLLK